MHQGNTLPRDPTWGGLGRRLCPAERSPPARSFLFLFLFVGSCSCGASSISFHSKVAQRFGPQIALEPSFRSFTRRFHEPPGFVERSYRARIRRQRQRKRDSARIRESWVIFLCALRGKCRSHEPILILESLIPRWFPHDSMELQVGSL